MSSKLNLKKLATQVIIYCIGLLVLAFGVAFAINSNLGISPVNSVPFAVHLAGGINVGTAVTIFFLVLIALQILILRRDFKLRDLTQIIFATIFGFFVDLTVFILGDFVLPTYAGQLVMLAISIVLIAIGVSVYLEAKLISLPPEGILLAFIQKYPQYTFARCKVVFDCGLVIIAVAITLIALRGVYGVREGTVISAIFLGKAIYYARKIVVYLLGKTPVYKIISNETSVPK